jgi:diamine N-acetyltransferase
VQKPGVAYVDRSGIDAVPGRSERPGSRQINDGLGLSSLSDRMESNSRGGGQLAVCGRRTSVASAVPPSRSNQRAEGGAEHRDSPPPIAAHAPAGHNAGMDSNEPDFIVVGEKVALGPLRPDLAAAYARWMNQLEVRRGLDQMGIATPQSQEKWVEENIEKGAKGEPQAVEFTVYDQTDSSPVGTAGLFHISHAHGRAEFGIAIGERRGQGLGTEATRLVLDFAFHVLQLRNVLLETLEWNVAGLTAYERAGFRRVGVRRGAVMSRGRPTDLVIMDAVLEDFGVSVLR